MTMYIRILVSSIFFSSLIAHADIELVSVSSSGVQGNGNSRAATTSADGRFVAFTSGAYNLVQGDTNGYDDIFVHDRSTGAIERVNVSSTGIQANQSSFSPTISADGRFVAFESIANNLVVDDTNFLDVFVHDRNTGITERVSVSSTGTQVNQSDIFYTPSISADGRFVAFQSSASNLVVGDTNGTSDVFVHDRSTGITERVSVSSTGAQVNAPSHDSSLSADGRFVAFTSGSMDLVNGDTNDATDIFLHDRNTGITELVSVTSAGTQAGNAIGGSFSPSLSADGRFVKFDSNARDMVENDTNRVRDVFVHDRSTGITERVSVSTTEVQGNDFSNFSSISADGRFVLFNSRATNLVQDDTNGFSDIFLHDRSTGITERVNVSSTGEQANGNSGGSISADGRVLAIGSAASNLVEGDTTGFADIFITENTLIESDNVIVTVRKLINNATRETQEAAAKLSTGTLYRQEYKITNQSLKRIYQVRVFEDGNLACNFYALNPGESRQRCSSYQTVLDGDQHTQVMATAKVSGSSQMIEATTDAFYTGLNNVPGKLRTSYTIKKPGTSISVDADTPDQAVILDSSQASLLFKVENIGEIELYGVKTYHDPVSPVNGGWIQQCVMGMIKPGQVRYCQRDISFSEPGLNHTMGRIQGRNAISGATGVVNAADPVYLIVP